MPRLSYSPIAHYAFLVGIISTAVWHLPGWNLVTKTRNMRYWNTLKVKWELNKSNVWHLQFFRYLPARESQLITQMMAGNQKDLKRFLKKVEISLPFPIEDCWIPLHYIPTCFVLPGSLYPYWKMMRKKSSKNESQTFPEQEMSSCCTEEQLFVQLNQLKLVWIGMNPVSSRYKLLFVYHNLNESPSFSSINSWLVAQIEWPTDNQSLPNKVGYWTVAAVADSGKVM